MTLSLAAWTLVLFGETAKNGAPPATPGEASASFSMWQANFPGTDAPVTPFAYLIAAQRLKKAIGLFAEEALLRFDANIPWAEIPWDFLSSKASSAVQWNAVVDTAKKLAPGGYAPTKEPTPRTIDWRNLSFQAPVPGTNTPWGVAMNIVSRVPAVPFDFVPWGSIDWAALGNARTIDVVNAIRAAHGLPPDVGTPFPSTAPVFTNPPVIKPGTLTNPPAQKKSQAGTIGAILTAGIVGLMAMGEIAHRGKYG